MNAGPTMKTRNSFRVTDAILTVLAVLSFCSPAQAAISFFENF